MTEHDNVYETPSDPVDRKDFQKLQGNFEKLQKKVLFASIFLAIVAGIALGAIGIGIYAVTRDLSTDDQQTASTGLSVMDSTNSSGSACNRVKCENHGTCVNIYPDNYMCACVASFYGRRCEKGMFESLLIYLDLQSLTLTPT